MRSNDLWRLCSVRWRAVDGQPLSQRETREFDFYGLKADYRWGGGNVMCYRVYIGDEIVEMLKPGSHSPQWWLCTPSDTTLVEIALRAEWMSQ